MLFLLSRFFAVLGFCICLPWVSSMSETKVSLETATPTGSVSSTDGTTYNGTTKVSPTATTPTTVTPTTVTLTTVASTKVTNTTNTATGTSITVSHTTARILTTSHGTSNTTSHLTTSHLTTDNVTTDHVTSGTFPPTDIHTTAASPVVTTTTPSGDKKASQFDPASFLGGIVLMLGLSVIAFVAYRCYRNRRSTTPPYRVVDE